MAIYHDGYDWDVDGFPGSFVYGDDWYISEYYADERWKRVRDFPEYWISNKGRLYSDRSDSFISGTPLKSGHVDISFTYRNTRFHRYLHRLVAEAFIPNPYNLPLIRHLDDNPLNNEVDNLAWGTQYDNVQDCIQAGRFRYFSRDDIELANAIRRTPIIAIRLSDGTRQHFESQQAAGRVLGVAQGDINSVLHGRRRQAKGYYFTFAEDDVNV